MTSSPPKVFISYSHDSHAHRERVLGLAERLRGDGIDARLDQYVNGAPPEGWVRWMLDEIDAARFVLAVCTETYYRRFRGHGEPGKGKEGNWEGAGFTRDIYDARIRNLKSVPVLFDMADERFIPEPLRGLTRYVLISEANYRALYDLLRGALGAEQLPPLERRQGTPLVFGDTLGARDHHTPGVAPSRLWHGVAPLFGREQELVALDEAWKSPETHLVIIVAWGGAGKTSLAANWAARVAARGFDGARYFDWSFHSQGSREQTVAASADQFIAQALAFFGDEAMANSAASPWEKGERLAQLVSSQRTLLVLDGLDPLQHPPGPRAGELRDPAVASLLRGLAQRNPGLCVVTTREPVAELAPHHRTTVQVWRLEHLPTPAGVALLRSLGAKGTDEECAQLVRDVGGHALTLNLLGRYLARAYDGDVRRGDRVRLAAADSAVEGGHAFRMMAAYDTWLGESGLEGARQLAVLRLLGLFSHPADAGCLAALRAKPPIVGLTEPLVDVVEDQWKSILTSLTELGLVSVQTGPIGAAFEASLDAQPLVREYFAAHVRAQNPEGWRVAHGRLYDHLTEIAAYQPDTLEGLQPLYQAIVHGCLAARHQEAFGVFRVRIRRASKAYSTSVLGALSADLGATAAFFEQPWRKVSSAVREDHQRWLFAQAGFYLRSLGRLGEAREPMEIALRSAIERNELRNAPTHAGNLGELELLLGETGAAVGHMTLAVEYADRSAVGFQRISKRSALANVLHHAGKRFEALILVREAERILAKLDTDHPLLSSIGSFQYCDILLAAVERDAWNATIAGRGLAPMVSATPVSAIHHAVCLEVEQRARQTLAWVSQHRVLLDAALDHLSLGRAVMCRRLLRQAPSSSARSEIFPPEDASRIRQHLLDAVNGLRHSGTQAFLSLGLLSRAWFRAIEGESDGARDDLDEAWRIAERGPMRLYLADIHLHRARLFHAVNPYPWDSPHADLAAARKLIEQCGYWRRKEELEDAEAAAKNW